MKRKTIFSGGTAITLALSVVATPALAEGEVNILTWEGYADQSFVAQFEQESGCKVTATYVGSNDDFAPKLAAGGGVYDLITPSIDTTKTMIEAGFVEPLDTSKISEWNNIYEKFRNAEGINHDGAVYGMPYSWGAIAFMYRVDKFPTPPTSIADLWSEAVKGRVSLWDDKSAIYVAARLNGDNDIYNLTDEQIEKAKAKLIEQKPLVRKYWATAGELVDLYAAGEVWISNTWAGYQSSLIKEKGIEVAEFIPKENAEGWMDSWMVVKDTPNLDCAYKFLNMQSSELGQCGVANVNGYSAANPVAAKKCMSPEQYEALHQDDPDYLNSLLLWENLGERIEAYTNAWNAVKSAN
ncbi:putative spermidine/putrescine transport system substrate-binding protein [Dongia mobilis]|uniref:Putative spermidine/putrescine transport system substrate-binding protein n=1 Tax=Dongia mobilis TaxID=578943 RepID=A0A4R6WRH8_9PROT|nr:ABC transporter substrate-binding protein [Dongia mobilis]TDQ84106.1 putative spermidine/putrescine transport system substrate-binding protein [Dongia mobilis]